MHPAGTNPDLIRREQPAYKAAADAADHVSGAPAALLASLLWGTADFLAGRASRAHPAVLVALVGQAAGLIALDADPAHPRRRRRVVRPRRARRASSASVAILAFYRALALGTMCVVAPIVATSAIVPVLAGVLIDGERPSALQWIGHGVALAGVTLASREPAHTKAIDAKQGAPARDRRRARSSASRSCSSARPRSTTRSPASPPRASSASPILGVLALARRRRARRCSALPKLGAIGLLDTGANTAFAIATTGGLLSLVAVLGGLFPVVTVALAYFFLHERLLPIQRVGVLLALAGIPLISA